MKPGDYFIGIIDFFSTMVPGAIASYIVMPAFKNDVPDWWIETGFGSIEGWAVFLVSSYALGQLLAAVGTMLLDPPVEGMRKGRMKTGRGWTILSAIKGERWNTVLGLGLVAILSWFRFCRLRWGERVRAFEYFLAVNVSVVA